MKIVPPPIARYESLHRFEFLRIILWILLHAYALFRRLHSLTGKHPHSFYSVLILSFFSTLQQLSSRNYYSFLQGNYIDDDYISLSLIVDEYFTGFT